MKKLILLLCIFLFSCNDDDLAINNIEVSLPTDTVEVDISKQVDKEDMKHDETEDEISEDEETNVIEKTFDDMNKEDVYWLQESLKIAGFYTAKDGDFGSKSKAALHQFREESSLLEASYNDVVKALQAIRDAKLAPNFNTNSVLLNKNYYLPSSFVPDDLREVMVKSNKTIELQSHVADAVESMFNDALADGITIYLASGYRSYDYQEGIFSRRVAKNGYEEAQTVVAIPGQSEHQTGLTIDITSEKMNFGLSQSFDQDPVFEWMMDNGHKYGFVLRYLKGREEETNYIFLK